jgi:hypothetical protein
MWIKRAFESTELLMAGDVPKTLVHLSSSPRETENLVDMLDWPVKMLQAIAEGVDGVLDREAGDIEGEFKRNRAAETLKKGLNTDVKRLRIEELDEDEKRCAPSEFSKLIDSEREGANLVLDDDHQAKAVKNDNATIRTKDWDFFLALGLPEEIRAREWREAAVKIRPLVMMKWWRRHQLRKCIK